MTLLYSSLIKLFLLFLLTIWRPSNESPADPRPIWNDSPLSSFLHVLDDENIDRQWVVRNVLGGMAAGFGLRGMPRFPSH